METKLKEIVKRFVDDQRICGPETIYQSDRVIENAHGFINDLLEEVGYWYEYPED